MNDSEPQHLGGAWVPPWIFRDENLSAPLKLTIGRILALSNKEGYCWATDDWLSKDMGVKRRTLQKRLRDLEEQGYITRDKDQSGDTTTRRLAPTRKTLRTHTQDFAHGGGGHTQNVAHAISSEDTESSNNHNWGELDETERLQRSTPSSPSPTICRVFERCRNLRKREIGKEVGPKLQLTPQRHNKIKDRLKEGWTPTQLIGAYAGLLNDEWHRKKNKREIEYCFRNDEQVRRFLSCRIEQMEEGRDGPVFWDE